MMAHFHPGKSSVIPLRRVARFAFVKHTKTGKMDQITIKCNKIYQMVIK
jgi:hypothetical protein